MYIRDQWGEKLGNSKFWYTCNCNKIILLFYLCSKDGITVDFEIIILSQIHKFLLNVIYPSLSTVLVSDHKMTIWGNSNWQKILMKWLTDHRFTEIWWQKPQDININVAASGKNQNHTAVHEDIDSNDNAMTVNDEFVEVGQKQ